MRADLPAELIFMLAILLTIASLFLYGLIIKRLLKLVKAKYLWIFPMVAGFLLLILFVVHFYRVFFYSPLLSTAGPADLFELVIGSLQLARVESFLLLGAGVFSLVGGLWYYLVSSR